MDLVWEGGFRSPTVVRWPGKIPPGQVVNDIASNLDWMPTLLAAAGEPDIKSKLKKGHKVGKMKYKVHLDGYNFLPFLTGKEKKGPREEFFYFSDSGDFLAMRVNNIKVTFMEQQSRGTYDVWTNEFRNLRVPLSYNLRADPYEFAPITSNSWWEGQMKNTWYLYPALSHAAAFLGTFKEFPPRHAAASVTMTSAMERIRQSGGK